jgi:hypothetical protein
MYSVRIPRCVGCSRTGEYAEQALNQIVIMAIAT